MAQSSATAALSSAAAALPALRDAVTRNDPSAAPKLAALKLLRTAFPSQASLDGAVPPSEEEAALSRAFPPAACAARIAWSPHPTPAHRAHTPQPCTRLLQAPSWSSPWPCP